MSSPAVNAWGSNVVPSLPEPLQRPALVDLGGSGFCMTATGIAHLVNDEDLDEYRVPTFAPPFYDPSKQ